MEDWVRNWTSGSWGNHGMRIDANGSSSVRFTAQEQPVPPALRLIYRNNNPPPPATLVSPASGAVGTTTPTLTANPVSPKSFTARLSRCPHNRGETLKAREWERFAKTRLLGELRGFGAKGRLTYRLPVGQILAAFSADPSGWDADSFYVETFVLPLYVPHEHVAYTVGKRLGTGFLFDADGFVADELLPLLLREGLPWLEAHSTPEQLLQNEDWKDRHNPHLVEIEAYSLILVGRHKEAKILLRGLKAGKGEYEWMKEIVSRCHLMAGLLDKSPEAAASKLTEWRRVSLQNIGLANEI